MNYLLVRRHTAYKQWSYLYKNFSSTNQSQIMNLRLQLQTLRRDNLSVSEYILRAKTIYDHLAASSELVNNRDLMMYIVQCMGPRYASFTTLFDMMVRTPTFGAFGSYLEGYDRMIAHQTNMDVCQSLHANVAVQTYVAKGPSNLASKQRWKSEWWTISK